ncbi:endonuclease MutS2 [Natronospora cellulosivora (SeqCode)]
MHNSILEILELNKIKAELKGYASTNIAKEIIDALKPLDDIKYIKKTLKEVSVASKLIQEFNTPSFGGVRDLREIIKKVNKGMILSQKELIDIKNTLDAFRSLRKYFDEIIDNLDPRVIDNYYGLVVNKGIKIIDLKSLNRELNHCFDDYGEIKDTASKKLSKIRSEINRMINNVRDKMENIIRNTKYENMLQDKLITRRRDRYVVPIKSEYRNTFQGIVHDQSSSGMTLFMEPMVIVKMNNRLSELYSEEEKEIYKILQKLSAEVAKDSHTLEANLKITTILDVIFARAAYSRALNAIEPEVNKSGVIDIKEGRHPLLGEIAVPIDIQLGGDFSTLIITGPNTGGKTVALKTVGLFVLMVECGMHIPAAIGTEISLFKNVFADIGDEQSIEQNLSTFSSHMNRIKSFIAKADKDSLILMDELGAGTDPKEGAALGISIMESLREKGAFTIVTTHYSQLKNYAYNKDGVENASVEFNIETLKPTYKVLMGIPGGSNAFAIAERLGIPKEIVLDAKDLLSSDEIEVEEIISGLNHERKKYKELKEEFLAKEQEAKELRKKYHEEVESLKKKKEDIVKKAHEKASDIIETARKQSKEILKKLKKSDFTSRSEVDREGNEVNQDFKTLDDSFLSSKELTVKDAKSQEDISIGDDVRILSVGRRGKVIDIDYDKEEVSVQAGIMTVKASLEDIVKAEMPEIKKKEMIKKYKLKKTQKVSSSLDLRGERYELAQRKVDKYLDDVFLAGLKQVEIIHGKGTGALREAVKDIIKSHKHVDSYRLGRQEEGGTGVTIVSVK